MGWIIIETTTPREHITYRYARCDEADPKMLDCLRRHLRNNPVFQTDGFTFAVRWVAKLPDGARFFPLKFQACGCAQQRTPDCQGWLCETLAALSRVIRDTTRSRKEREQAERAHHWLQEAARTRYYTGETQLEWVQRRIAEGYRPGKAGRFYVLVCEGCIIHAYRVGKEAHAVISYLLEQGFLPVRQERRRQ